MTVVHLITGLGLGGAERALSNLVLATRNKSYHQAVVSMTRVGRVGRQLELAGIEVHALGMKGGASSATGLWKLVSLLSHLQPDILHCWMYHANLMGALVAGVGGVRHLVWGIRCSDVDLSQYGIWTRIVVKVGAFLSRSPEITVLNSQAGKRVHAARGYDVSRMVVIYNGIDTEIFKPEPRMRAEIRRELGLRNDAFLIGLIARFDPMKGHETFFEAASQLVPSTSDVHFVLVGEGISTWNALLWQMILRRGLESKVCLLGPRHDIPRLTAALDIATSSSYFGEGFSNSIGEAMSCGVPCVVTDVGDSAFIVGPAGWVVSPRDAAGLASRWSDALAMTCASRTEMGRAGRERIKSFFSLGRNVERYEELYASICSHR